jgi:rubrerythrin
MRSQIPCGAPPAVEELSVRHDILETVLAAAFEVDGVLAELDNERAHLSELSMVLQSRRDRGVNLVTLKPVRTSKNPKDMLRYDLENENDTIRNYRDRIRQCETLGEYAMAEQIRQILMQEQDHQIDLATALGEEVPDVSGGPKGRRLRQHR